MAKAKRRVIRANTKQQQQGEQQQQQGEQQHGEQQNAVKVNEETIQRDQEATQEATLNSSDNTITSNDNSNTTGSTNEHRPETPQTISEANSKNTEGTSKSISQDQIIDELKNIGISSIIANSWRDLIPTNIRDFFLTKEDYELVRSYMTMLVANADRNMLEWIRNKTTDECSLDRLKQLIVIRKVGSILLDSYKSRLDILKHELSEQTKVIQSYAQILQACANALMNSFIMNIGQIPNIATDIKLTAIITSAITGIAATGIAIGNIKNQITDILGINEYCIRGCRQCAEPITITTLKMVDLGKESQAYNEGIEYSRTIELTQRMLEKLMQLELAALEQQLQKKQRNTKKTDNA